MGANCPLLPQVSQPQLCTGCGKKQSGCCGSARTHQATRWPAQRSSTAWSCWTWANSTRAPIPALLLMLLARLSALPACMSPAVSGHGCPVGMGGDRASWAHAPPSWDLTHLSVPSSHLGHRTLGPAPTPALWPPLSRPRPSSSPHHPELSLSGLSSFVGWCVKSRLIPVPTTGGLAVVWVGMLGITFSQGSGWIGQGL